MEEDNKDFIEWLKSIGAEDIKEIEGDEAITFVNGLKKITIFWVWHNDTTAGIGTEVEGA